MFNSEKNEKKITYTLDALVKTGSFQIASDTDAGLYDRIKGIEISSKVLAEIEGRVSTIGVTSEFKKVIDTFKPAAGITPAGFRHELRFGGDKSLRIDLKRDIAFMENSVRRPTNVLFSANTANPFEVMSVRKLIANLTTNPQIIYSNFLNNPNANVGNQFRDRFEVLNELKNLVGPGVDISVELNDPFADKVAMMEEIAQFEEVLSRYQLVVKVPHTGPINSENVKDFLAGKYGSYDQGASKDFFYGHNLAYELQEKGYRVNFTLMAEPHQTALALLAKPYFINAFVQRRYDQTQKMASLLNKLDETGDTIYEEEIHDFMKKADMISSDDINLKAAVEKARILVDYRNADLSGKDDGLDSVRHSLRVLKTANLPDTRLIVCNMKTAEMYYDLDRMVTEPEFADMKQRVIITCEPEYFAQFTASPTIYYYQRSFLNSVK